MDTVFLDLFKALISLGPGGVIAAISYYNWREERDERRALQAGYVKLLEQKIESDNSLSSALERMADKVGGRP